MTWRFPSALVAAAVAGGVAVWAQTAPQWQDVIRNLRNPSVDARLQALGKLEAADYTAAAEAVAPLVTDADDSVQAAAIDTELTFFLTERLTAVRILGVGSGKSRAQLAFDTGPLVRTAAPAPPVLVDRLMTAMRDENARIRFDAVHALGFIAEPPLSDAQAAALSDGLDHYDPVMRTATARVVGRLRVRGAAPKLLAALDDSNANVRQYAIEALGWLREDRALSALRSIVIRRAEFSYDALLALARIGAADDRTLFRQRLSDRQTVVRRAAAEGLGRLHDDPSAGTLEQLLKTDPSNEVRLAAAYALQRLGQVQTHVIAAMLVLKDEGAQARDYLLELGPDAVPGIQSALKVASDSRHRADLVQLWGRLGAPSDIAAIEPLLSDRDERVVRAATNAIQRLKR